jgi:NADP-dependent 3-hydroxy acid dehydrogenase YdfG
MASDRGNDTGKVATTKVSTTKVAIVTGASRGIGAAVASRLARDGFAVLVNYAGNAAAAESVVEEIEQQGGRALVAQGDVSDPRVAPALFDAAEAAFGAVDVLVNNAGVMALASIAESDDALFDRHIAVNLKGTFNTLREAAGRLRDGGRIINFSTSVVGTRLERYGVYAATKAAVETLTAILAKEMRVHSSGWPRPKRSPGSWRSWPARTAAGSTARCCGRTVEWSDGSGCNSGIGQAGVRSRHRPRTPRFTRASRRSEVPLSASRRSRMPRRCR